MEILKSAHELDGPKTPEQIENFEAKVDLFDILRNAKNQEKLKAACEDCGLDLEIINSGNISRYSLSQIIEVVSRLIED